MLPMSSEVLLIVIEVLDDVAAEKVAVSEFVRLEIEPGYIAVPVLQLFSVPVATQLESVGAVDHVAFAAGTFDGTRAKRSAAATAKRAGRLTAAHNGWASRGERGQVLFTRVFLED